LRDVLVEFVGALSGIDTVVGHNLAFDLKIVGAEFVRCSVIDPFPGKRQVCTMLASTAFCMIPGAYGYKWPKLNELYTRLFARDMGMAHNSLLDVKATMDCFFELKKIGVLS
jgi:DNA polymerase III epsilon subunit-like protein